MFLLYYNASTSQVHAMNGSGRSGSQCTVERIRSALNGASRIPMSSVHAATIPGAAAGWVDTVERFGSGKVDLSRVLAPAIKLAENGFPVSEVASYSVRVIPEIERVMLMNVVASYGR